MTALEFSLLIFVLNVIIVIGLLTYYYMAKINEAREEANFWRRKSEHADKPSA